MLARAAEVARGSADSWDAGSWDAGSLGSGDLSPLEVMCLGPL